ncbi:MAG: M50 family metallopeptidase [Anaerolineaceae bacterium]
MSIFVTILQFVFIFGLLIFFHELGHFLASKALGIEIEEFGFGYPPRLVKLGTWKGTDVTLNWIPFGGFVRPKGEGDANVQGGMSAAPAWKRLIILLSGPVMNFLVGIIVLIVMYAAVGTPVTSQVLITEVSPDSPAQTAQLQPGDIITKVDDTPVTDVTQLQSLIQENLGKEISLTLQRDDQTVSVTLTPRVNPPEGKGAVGVMLSNPLQPMPFFDAVGSAFKTFGYQAHETLMLPVNLINGSVSGDEARLVGIKGIFDLFSNATKLDETSPVASATPLPVYRLSIVSTVAIALGLTNLLPIPALDGGQILFLLPEFLFKKRIPQNVANAINTVFFFLLIILMVYVNVQDFINPVLQP